MHQRVLHVEVVLVMEDGNLIAICSVAIGVLVFIGIASIGRDGNGGEVNWRGRVGIAIDGGLGSGGGHG